MVGEAKGERTDGSAVGPGTATGRWSARWSGACRKLARVGAQPICSSTASARSGTHSDFGRVARSGRIDTEGQVDHGEAMCRPAAGYLLRLS